MELRPIAIWPEFRQFHASRLRRHRLINVRSGVNVRTGGTEAKSSAAKYAAGVKSRALPFGQRVVPMVAPVSVQSLLQVCRGVTPMAATGRQRRESVRVLGRRAGARARVR